MMKIETSNTLSFRDRPTSTREEPMMSYQTSVSASSAFNSAVAGYAAGVTGVVFGHPLDSAKVWMQTNTAGKNKHFASSSSGAGGPSTSASASSASASASPLSSSSAGPSISPASRATGALHANYALKRLAPASMAASQMSTLARQAPVQTLQKTLTTVRALYSGIAGPLFTVGIVQSINFTTYDAMRRVLHQRDHPHQCCSEKDYLHNDSLLNVATAGFVAGTGLAFITSPLIRIKTRQQITGQGFRQALRETLFVGGRLTLSGCFRGFTPHLISETFGRALYYTAYEGCKRSIASYKEEQGLGVTSAVSLQERMGSAAAAGILCWAAIFPIDSLRSRMYHQEGPKTLSTWEMAKVLGRERSFYRGFWVTVLRAGPVAAAVLPVYDYVLENLSSSS